MDHSNQPTKEAVRKWLQAKLRERVPPPDPQQIRRELGWGLARLERGDVPSR